MSILKMRPKKDAKPVDPFIGYLQINANATPIIRRPVTASAKDNAVAELTTMAAQMWKMFNIASCLSLALCKEDATDCEVIVKFTR